MDRFDRKILAALHENARISFAELARRVNLSAPAVADRVAKLEQAGVITGYRAQIDPGRVGLPISCLIELTVKHLEYYLVIEQIRNTPEVIECASITGTSGLMIKVAVDTMASLQALIARLMQFGDTKTSIIIDMPVAPRMPALQQDD
ncbi:Lrp/AsnC family transcriptional regulator [Chromobacterium subtsugae]|uniref:Lrp/AsnC family transcriptional regulator n=2 Tax=Pseudomonadota TaxID=1224 RepID=A0ABS7FG53_9NEIS|nr:MULTISPECIES: Lrp/AsnC family transcriptional regulator [Chromobacterium]KUM03892.1 AsnC family transcriptional regulator [Chromobacterium subtsugae]KZE87447.1 AsnC family transcriptional regulator [Chromobacterium sp. F49]MBW7566596.1 Lrp/AsnC family transcriptional regulator [Chromobacterium subtsugae]MBW8288283.1 Lrp/AsnC family transcriptional regulator [Chromobacterium subtsugae]OBU87268.1 AsnC family transcriptional regulator [Chromobacterium subtsugae]